MILNLIYSTIFVCVTDIFLKCAKIFDVFQLSAKIQNLICRKSEKDLISLFIVFSKHL